MQNFGLFYCEDLAINNSDDDLWINFSVEFFNYIYGLPISKNVSVCLSNISIGLALSTTVLAWLGWNWTESTKINGKKQVLDVF